MKQTIKQITSNHKNVAMNRTEFRQKAKYCDQIINCNDANPSWCSSCQVGAHALCRDEHEHDLQVTSRKRQTQLHPQSILRAVHYFQGPGLPWKGFRPATRSGVHTGTSPSHVWFQSNMRTTSQSSMGRRQDHHSSHNTRGKSHRRSRFCLSWQFLSEC